MGRALSLLVLLGLLGGSAWAGGLAWEYDTSQGGVVPAQATIKKGPASTGPWTTVATIPSLPASFTFTYQPDSQWYRVENTGGVSNSVQYVQLASAYDDTALKASIAALDTRVTATEAKNASQDAEDHNLKIRTTAVETKNATQDSAITSLIQSVQGLTARIAILEAPAPTGSKVIVKTLSDSQIEVSCVNGTRPVQVLVGNTRLLTCS